MTLVRTSITDPICVDFLPRETSPLHGRIGLTIAPGKKDSAGRWNRDLDQALKRLRETVDTKLLVSLVEDHELILLGIEDLRSQALAAGIRVVRHPIRDAGIPKDMDAIVRLVRVVLAAAEAGDNTVIHCRGGLGRSGLLAACCLAAQGHAARSAILTVRAARTGAVETREQERFVSAFLAAWHTGRPLIPASSRFVGCLLGGAIGDALGYPVEFLRSTQDIQRVLGPVVPEHLPRRPGGKALVSDDTQMTLFTTEGLIRAFHRARDRGICSTEVVLFNAYLRWLSTQTGAGAAQWRDPVERGWLLDAPELHSRRAPGNTCLGALEQAREGMLGTVDAPLNDSKGCGAVMRSAPIGLAAESAAEAFTLARNAGALTHGHPSGYLSAGYLAAVIHGVARYVPLVEAISQADVLLRQEREADEVASAVTAARRLALAGPPTPEGIESLGGGWVGEEALAIALVCALTVKDGTPASIADALWRSVVHGGDSDSTGSITGNILGAMFGTQALPATWIEDVELRETIERLAFDLHMTFVLNVDPEPLRYPPN
jgi:ADP-ribosylglycohydrolase/protein-tyrosine phosphatase